jgi:hypothetical protein
MHRIPGRMDDGASDGNEQMLADRFREVRRNTSRNLSFPVTTLSTLSVFRGKQLHSIDGKFVRTNEHLVALMEQCGGVTRDDPLSQLDAEISNRCL